MSKMWTNSFIPKAFFQLGQCQWTVNHKHIASFSYVKVAFKLLMFKTTQDKLNSAEKKNVAIIM